MTEIIGDSIGGGGKWAAFVKGSNSRFYFGIPYHANRVVVFDIVHKSHEEIGPDLSHIGGEYKWFCGALARDGCIYCPPSSATHFLKIDTLNQSVQVLDNVPLPEQTNFAWRSVTLASDGCLYSMPFNAACILKFNPETQTASSVGDDLGGLWSKYSGTVMGKDNCIYGIPCTAKYILKFNYSSCVSIMIGKKTKNSDLAKGGLRNFASNFLAVGKTFAGKLDFGVDSGGVLGSDGCIYAADDNGVILKIDPSTDDYSWIGEKFSVGGDGWGKPTVGADSCIYWPPCWADKVLKFDVNLQQRTLIGDGQVSAKAGAERDKWYNGALVDDGFIYCIPYNATRMLCIDTRGPPTMPQSTEDPPIDIFVSARFRGDNFEAEARSLHQELLKVGMNAYIIPGGGGDNFGEQVMKALHEMKTMVAFCTSDYGAKTLSPYSTYHELQVANERDKHILPIRRCAEWPPEPTDSDGGSRGKELNSFVLRKGLACLYWHRRKWDAAECAKEVKEAFDRRHSSPSSSS